MINKINDVINEHTDSNGFNPKSSARLKLNFKGEMTIEKSWIINENMARIRRDCFSQVDKYNILQLIWQISDISDQVEDDTSAGIIEDFILEKPDQNFREFIKEKLTEEKTKFDIDKLTEFGIEAIKNALNIMEKEEEV